MRIKHNAAIASTICWYWHASKRLMEYHYIIRSNNWCIFYSRSMSQPSSRTMSPMSRSMESTLSWLYGIRLDKKITIVSDLYHTQIRMLSWSVSPLTLPIPLITFRRRYDPTDDSICYHHDKMITDTCLNSGSPKSSISARASQSSSLDARRICATTQKPLRNYTRPTKPRSQKIR